MTREELSDRLLDLGARIGNVVDTLPGTRFGRHVAGQLVRCGTSPGPNYEEVCPGKSRADFVHKMKIVLKELRETRYWLRPIMRAKVSTATKMGDLLDESNQLCNILGQSVVTAKGIKGKKASDR